MSPLIEFLILPPFPPTCQSCHPSFPPLFIKEKKTKDFLVPVDPPINPVRIQSNPKWINNPLLSGFTGPFASTKPQQVVYSNQICAKLIKRWKIYAPFTLSLQMSIQIPNYRSKSNPWMDLLLNSTEMALIPSTSPNHACMIKRKSLITYLYH